MKFRIKYLDTWGLEKTLVYEADSIFSAIKFGVTTFDTKYIDCEYVDMKEAPTYELHSLADEKFDLFGSDDDGDYGFYPY